MISSTILKTMNSREIQIGKMHIGGGLPIAVQTMCNTHTSDVEATLKQCREASAAGCDIIRITVPSSSDVAHITKIRQTLRAEGIEIPIVADIHFSSETALAVAPHVDKVRINPGNFHRDHAVAREKFARLIEVCKQNGTAIRIGLNHGSLGEYITNLYGNTPEAMARAAMEWLEMCRDNDFSQAVVSLKSSNTITMVEAYRTLVRMMEEAGLDYPLHVGVTEAGGGIPARMKSCAAIWTLLSEGIGDTIRVSLTEDPVNEVVVGRYLEARRSGRIVSALRSVTVEAGKAIARYESPSLETLVLDFSCDFGKALLDKRLSDITLEGSYVADDGSVVDLAATSEGKELADELLQACRVRFYGPEYIACPGCGRTMYDLQGALAKVKERTKGLSGTVIAVMGCIVNGPGEMADADWGYVGEGKGMVSLYKGKERIRSHVPEAEAPDLLLSLIRDSQK